MGDHFLKTKSHTFVSELTEYKHGLINIVYSA